MYKNIYTDAQTNRKAETTKRERVAMRAALPL